MKQLLMIACATAVLAATATAATPPFLDPANVNVTNPSLDVHVVSTVLPFPFYATASGEKSAGTTIGEACTTIQDTYVKVTGMFWMAGKGGGTVPLMNVTLQVKDSNGEEFSVFFRRPKQEDMVGGLQGSLVFYTQTVPVTFWTKMDDELCIRIQTPTSALSDVIFLDMTLYGEAY